MRVGRSRCSYKFLFLFYVDVSEYTYVYQMCTGTCGDQKRALDFLEPELQLNVIHPLWVGGTLAVLRL